MLTVAFGRLLLAQPQSRVVGHTMKRSSTSSDDNMLNKFLAECWPDYGTSAVLMELREWNDHFLVPVDLSLRPLLRNICDRFREEMLARLSQGSQQLKDRYVVRLDTSHATKRPEDILAKMVRKWRKNRAEEYVAQKRYRTCFPDAIRYRYVVNFLSDGVALDQRICRELQDSTPLSRHLECVDRAANDTTCRDSRKCRQNRCTVDLPLDTRKTGERSWKHRLRHRESKICVELQICTQLQEAWDKKEHFLIYERKREGKKTRKSNDIVLRNASDLLYVVDRELEELKKSILNEEKHKKESEQ